jgi:hypothetical protein
MTETFIAVRAEISVNVLLPLGNKGIDRSDILLQPINIEILPE